MEHAIARGKARYLFAAGAVLAALLARCALGGVLGNTLPCITFFPAVMLAASLGGLGPGLLATALSAAAACALVAAPHSPTMPAHEAAGLMIFALIGAFVSSLCESQRRAALNAAREATRRRETEAQRQAGELQFRELVEALPQLLWTCRPDGSCDYLSRQWCEYTGRPEASQLGSGWVAVIHPEDAAGLLRRWEQTVAAGVRMDVEYRIRGADGNYRWFAARAVPTRNAEGRVVKWVGMNLDIEDRKVAEQQLRDVHHALELRVAERTATLARQSRILEAVLDGMGQGVIVADGAGRFLVINEAARALHGHGALDTTPQRWTQDYRLFLPDGTTPFPPEDLPLARALRGESVDDVEMLVRPRARPAGVFISVSGRPLRLCEGERGGLVVFRDCTQRRTAERQARAQNVTSRALLDAATLHDAMAVALPAIREALGWEVGELWVPVDDGQVLQLVEASHSPSPGLAELSGLGRTVRITPGLGLPGRGWAERRMAWIGDLANDPNFCRAQAAGKLGLRSGLAFPIVSGGRVLAVLDFLMSEATPPSADVLAMLEGLAGQIGQFIERRKAESSLAAVSRRLQAVLDAATEVSVISTDPDGLITVFNTGAERMLGYSAAEMVGKQTPALIHVSEEVAAHGVALAARFGQPVSGFGVFVAKARQGGHDEREWTYIRKDGSRLTVSLVVTALRNEQGTITGFLGIAVDITKRKCAEDALRQAKEEAEAANKAKGEFLANMSHEIRTPMNGILGMTDLALDTDLSPEQRELLSTVKASGEALLGIINDILDFSKLEAGKLELDPHPVALRDALDDLLRPLAHRAHQKGLELACHVRPDVPDALVVDAGRLRQVLVNLVGNAIKFTEKGEVVVRVETELVGGGEAVLRFAVTDTGIGIPTEKLRSIFEPFSQADASTTRQYGGTGLGLSISSKLVALVGGRLWAESAPGEGSTFRFTARCGLRPHPAPPLPAELNGLRVLIVNAHATGRMILAEMLSNWRLRPSEAASLPEAVDALQRAAAAEPFPFVLLDASVGTTEEVGRFGQAVPAGKAAPAIILLSSAGRQNVARWAGLGVAATLPKPPKQSDLLDALQAATRSRPHPAWVMRRAPETAPAASRPLRVLLAEDNLVNQRVATVMLQRQGHRVTVAGNGREALETLERGSFDVVLMDVQMPEMDGLEATAAIRARERVSRSRTPIIAMTANAMKGDREMCLEAGMDGYVSKPVRACDLWAAIAAAVPQASPPAAPPAEDDPPSGVGVLDAAALRKRLGGNDRLLAQVLTLFQEDSRRLMGELAAAVADGDAPRLGRAAHALNGALGNLSAAAARAAATRLEALARAGGLGEAPGAYRALVGEIERLNAALAGLTPADDFPGGERA
jgi:PAS domain S-box-containing protein